MFKMIHILIYISTLFLSSCENNGIEGYVNEPITISATNPEDGQDVDYYWTCQAVNSIRAPEIINNS